MWDVPTCGQVLNIPYSAGSISQDRPHAKTARSHGQNCKMIKDINLGHFYENPFYR
jgi:hypothetical protein